MKALALISGGLDSILAARLITDQGVEVVGVGVEQRALGRGVPVAHQHEVRFAVPGHVKVQEHVVVQVDPGQLACHVSTGTSS